tara:strand:+ start:1788 stop:2219 length:432 start_codon:yes stop_codon:yes gene_type:complete
VAKVANLLVAVVDSVGKTQKMKLMEVPKIAFFVLSLFAAIHQNAALAQEPTQPDPEGFIERYIDLENEYSHCANDSDCALLTDTPCFNPCGATAVNPEIIDQLIQLHDAYGETRGACSAAAACPPGDTPSAICANGECQVIWQ